MTISDKQATKELWKILREQHYLRREEERGDKDCCQTIRDNLRKIETVLKKGANPNGRCPYGCNFLEKAIEYQDYDIFKKLVKAGAKLQSSDNVPLLYRAVNAVTNQKGFNILKFLCDKECTLEGLSTAEKISCIRWNENYIFTGFWYGDFKGKYCHGDGGDIIFACTLLMIERGMFEEEFPIIIAFFERFFSTEQRFSPENKRIDAMKKAHESYLASQRSEKIAHQNPKGLRKARSSNKAKQID